MNPVSVAADGWLTAGGRRIRCALGRGGVRNGKREGDGATPAGIWRPQAVLYRSGRIFPPRCRLPLIPVRKGDGWCDAPDDPAYNQPVRHPFRASAEHLWRDEAVYDLVVVLDHNRHPATAHKGSAIFMHICRPGYAPTEGCIALTRRDLRWLVSRMGPATTIHVRGSR